MNWTATSLLASFIAGISIGIVLGAIILSADDEGRYKEASIMTCEYANDLANVTNMQSVQLEICTGREYTKMQFLDCDKLRRG